ncbi:NUDIX domain-containing protein [Cellulosimicrobium sp. BIT-GX5]|uniref:NUDIX domain-containing protein n=2 Tax=Cellulosimicrobium composti TaxID=2672572 RepID=A0A6N7ZHT6_9MICO|nr:NUDIX domain-containing protein [Cellulosimicrobium composti]NDO88703.1 NUDIX hydrolase [Cellulosimicrobium composti]TWG84282.1 8-oxo-dGTP diphosphatase [Cellulosimicrobium cellulans J34]SMF14608.1 8-oxo-dGTP diphosphatase [Cellulosimicrobium cellulans J1]
MIVRMSTPDPARAVPPSAALLPVTVDVVALTVRDDALHVLLVERGVEPFRGALALPGGFVLPGERLAAAARRELAEETGVRPPGHLEQLRTYGPLDRDPRGPVLSVAYLLLAPEFGVVHAGSDAGGAAWHPVEPLLGAGPDDRLAFDHARILADGVERARAKLEYSALATAFCPPEFTVADLRRVYEAVWGVRLDPRNFSRKATTTAGFLEETGRTTSGGTGRPAALYRAAPATSGTGAAADARPADVDPDDAPASVPAVLDPPLMRPRR